MNSYSAIVRLPFAVVGVRLSGNVLSRIEFLPDDSPLYEAHHPLAIRTVAALEAYVRDASVCLDLPLARQGTPFQQMVWRALRDIDPGATVTYGELARQLHTGARAVGSACRTNPVPLVVPCHRVVAKYDRGGYAGDRNGGWTRIKHWLLAHEARKGGPAVQLQ